MEGRRHTRIDADPKAVGPRILILLEEFDATTKQPARYGEEIRESGDPKGFAAVDALNEILCMGRRLRMHVLLIARSATARVLGVPEVREQFFPRILARYGVNAWRMLAPEVRSAPKSTKHPGRAQVVSGGSARETQILFFTETEAREWATTGKKAGAADGPVPVQLLGPPADSLPDAGSTTTPGPTPVPEPPASGKRPDDARNLTPATAAASGELAANPTATPSAPPAQVVVVVDEDQAVGLREATEHHLSGITLAVPRLTRANDPPSPALRTSTAPNPSTASATSRGGPATGPAPPPAPLTSTDRPWSLQPTRPPENTRLSGRSTEKEHPTISSRAALWSTTSACRTSRFGRPSITPAVVLKTEFEPACRVVCRWRRT
ncbi:hypothetical protein ACWDXD_31910 [Streptomyces sp. NPDC003314]